MNIGDTVGFQGRSWYRSEEMDEFIFGTVCEIKKLFFKVKFEDGTVRKFKRSNWHEWGKHSDWGYSAPQCENADIARGYNKRAVKHNAKLKLRRTIEEKLATVTKIISTNYLIDTDTDTATLNYMESQLDTLINQLSLFVEGAAEVRDAKE